MSIWRLLGLEKRPEATETDVESLRKITDALDAMDSVKGRFIAAFAYLLGRVAHADLKISKAETREMERLVMEKGGLPKDQAVLVVQIAKSQNRLFGHVENFLVAREFNKIATREEKLKLLHCLFALSSSDESISMREDREIRQIASELGLEHRDFIDIRRQYRKHLDVLRKRSDE